MFQKLSLSLSLSNSLCCRLLENGYFVRGFRMEVEPKEKDKDKDQESITTKDREASPKSVHRRKGKGTSKVRYL